MTQSNESEKKLSRTIIHIFSGIVIMLILIFYEKAVLLLFFIFILGIILSAISFSVRIPIICHFLDTCELERNKKFPGKSAVFMLASSLLVAKFLPLNIALASIAILTFADPISHYASNFSKKKYKNKFLNKEKNIIGTVLAMITAFIASSIFISWEYALPASILAILTEIIILKLGDEYIDDNLLVPLVAGIVMFLITRLI